MSILRILPLDNLVDLLAVHAHLARCLDANLVLVASLAQKRYHDVIAYADFFAYAPCQD
jgi:hypothetical protein